MLNIYAGKTALNTIKEQGFKQELFTAMLGASGGPKWFTLFGLDKYIFSEFFKTREQPIDLIGSSAGAFRFAALSQRNPVEKISTLAYNYAETTYSAKPNKAEITNSVNELLKKLFGENGRNEILSNDIYRPHFIVCKCKGLTTFENKLLQGLGLIGSMGLNRINRGLLNKQYQRFVFHSPYSTLKVNDNHNFNTQYVPLNNENLSPALSASGAIPMVMEGIKNIPSAPNGMYRDGGIIDYHFDLDIQTSNGLTLYPHFNSAPKPGWFDKNINRTITKNHYDNVVMLVPSSKFIESLPYNKIPDRTDFTEIDEITRIKYWKEVLLRTDELAESLDNFIDNPNINQIIPL